MKGTIAEKLALLERARSSPASAESRALLKRGLGDASAEVVLLAAKLVQERQMHDLVSEIATASQRFFMEKSSGRRHVLAALVKILDQVGYREPEVYLLGLRGETGSPRLSIGSWQVRSASAAALVHSRLSELAR